MPTYLDYAATAPIRPSVLASYGEYLSQLGNPSSIHSFGQKSRELLEQAREEVAGALGADRNEVIFTSSGTEANNLAIKGLYWSRVAKNPKRNLIITSAAEHHAVLDAIDWLIENQGARVWFIPTSSDGQPDLTALGEFLLESAEQVALISLMWVNNEIGVINPVAEVVSLAGSIPVHSDAVAAVGHTDINFGSSGLATLALSGHKFGSPIGVGVLLVARSQKLTPLHHGGGQERKMRSGTASAALAKALADALLLAKRELDGHDEHFRPLTQRLIEGVLEIAPDAILTAENSPRLANLVHFQFPGCSGESLLFLLDMSSVAVSTGAACTAGVAEPSHVLLAMGKSETEAASGIRISLGHGSSILDIEQFLSVLPEALAKARLASEASRA